MCIRPCISAFRLYFVKLKQADFSTRSSLAQASWMGLSSLKESLRIYFIKTLLCQNNRSLEGENKEVSASGMSKQNEPFFPSCSLKCCVKCVRTWFICVPPVSHLETDFGSQVRKENRIRRHLFAVQVLLDITFYYP